MGRAGREVGAAHATGARKDVAELGVGKGHQALPQGGHAFAGAGADGEDVGVGAEQRLQAVGDEVQQCRCGRRARAGRPC